MDDVPTGRSRSRVLTELIKEDIKVFRLFKLVLSVDGHFVIVFSRVHGELKSDRQANE